MPPSLAEQLYAAWSEVWRKVSVPSLPWDQLTPITRAAWERVAKVAREQVANAEMRERFDHTLDAERERRHGIRVVEQSPDPRPLLPEWPTHAPGDVVAGPTGVFVFTGSPAQPDAHSDIIEPVALEKAVAEYMALPPADVVAIDMDANRVTLSLTFTDVELCKAVLDGQRDFNRSAYATFEDAVARRIAKWLERWPELADAVRAGDWRKAHPAGARLVPIAAQIAAWLRRTTEPNDPCDGHWLADEIDAGKWRST